MTATSKSQNKTLRAATKKGDNPNKFAKTLSMDIRAFLTFQIHFFFVFPLEVISKKIIKNIPYGERVQLVLAISN